MFVRSYFTYVKRTISLIYSINCSMKINCYNDYYYYSVFPSKTLVWSTLTMSHLVRKKREKKRVKHLRYKKEKKSEDYHCDRISDECPVF